MVSSISQFQPKFDAGNHLQVGDYLSSGGGRRVVQRGDQLSVSRGLYAHHAIYVGDGMLIEFGSGCDGGPVAYVDYETFRRGSAVSIVRSGGERAVERAKSSLGRGRFNLVTNNCEHFATWCVTGEWKSNQVRTAVVAACFVSVLVLLARS